MTVRKSMDYEVDGKMLRWWLMKILKNLLMKGMNAKRLGCEGVMYRKRCWYWWLMFMTAIGLSLLCVCQVCLIACESLYSLYLKRFLCAIRCGLIVSTHPPHHTQYASLPGEQCRRWNHSHCPNPCRTFSRFPWLETCLRIVRRWGGACFCWAPWLVDACAARRGGGPGAGHCPHFASSRIGRLSGQPGS